MIDFAMSIFRKYFLLFCFWAGFLLTGAHASLVEPEPGEQPAWVVDRVGVHPLREEWSQKMEPLRQAIKGLKDHDDVHKLDTLVFGPGKAVRLLAATGTDLGVGHDGLSFAGVAAEMEHFVLQNPGFAPEDERLCFLYGKAPFEPQALTQHIRGFFQTISSQGASIPGLAEEGDTVRRVASLAWTSALLCWGQKDSPYKEPGWDGTYPVARLLGGIVEDRTTGGCPQGVANRLFREYVAILEHIGL
jgi:hypothetical protein